MTRLSDPSEPVVALVFPVSAGKRIGHLDRFEILGAFEAELRRDPESERRPPLWFEGLRLEVQNPQPVGCSVVPSRDARHLPLSQVRPLTFSPLSRGAPCHQR